MLPKRPPHGRFRSSPPDTSKSIAMDRQATGLLRRKSLAAGHRGQDDDGVALGDRGLETLEHAHVLVVEVDVDVAVEVAVLAEELLAGGGVLGGEGAQDLADVGAASLYLGLAARLRAQDRWDANSCHEGGDPSLGGQRLTVAASAGAEGVVVWE